MNTIDLPVLSLTALNECLHTSKNKKIECEI